MMKQIAQSNRLYLFSALKVTDDPYLNLDLLYAFWKLLSFELVIRGVRAIYELSKWVSPTELSEGKLTRIS